MKYSISLSEIQKYEKHEKCGIIPLLDKGENYMSAMLMVYNKNGAVITTDSRIVIDNIIFDEKIKTYENSDIIIGYTGLNFDENVNFEEIIVEELLKGKNIEDIMNLNYNNQKLKDLIPDVEGNNIHVYYAKKNGEVKAFDIRKDDIRNFAENTSSWVINAYVKNVDLKGLMNKYFPNYFDDWTVEKLKEISIELIKEIIDEEVKYAEKNKNISYIAGKIQSKIINFKK